MTTEPTIDLSTAIEHLGQAGLDWKAEAEAWEAQAGEYREILGDLVDLANEEAIMGRWPGFKERHDEAWRRAQELFEP